MLADTEGFLDTWLEAEVTTCDLAIHSADIGTAEVLQHLRPRQGTVIGSHHRLRQWPPEHAQVLDAELEQENLMRPG